MTSKLFISYCHADEWLKDEFITAVSSLINSGNVEIWHDRCILPGKCIDDEVADKLESSDVMILLISQDFLASKYCYQIEFKRAYERYLEEKMEIVPIRIRHCDFDIEPLKKLNFLPSDAIPVNPIGAKKADNELRDSNWSLVSKGVRKVINPSSKKNISYTLTPELVERRIEHLDFKNLRLGQLDISEFFQEPEVIYTEESQDIVLNNLTELVDFIVSDSVTFVSGDDRSGKSSLLFYLQQKLVDQDIPTIILKGPDLKNNSLGSEKQKALNEQLGTSAIEDKDLIILIDDIDECMLAEHRQLKLVENLDKTYKSIVLTAYSKMAVVPFRKVIVSEIYSFSLEPLPSNKIYQMVETWCGLGVKSDLELSIQKQITKLYQTVQQLLMGGTIPSYAPIVKTFLQVADSTMGGDIAITSNAACYDSFITIKLKDQNIPSNRIDLLKGFLGFFAGELEPPRVCRRLI